MVVVVVGGGRSVVMIIVASLAMGAALMRTGGADWLAQIFLSISFGIPSWAILGLLMLAMAALTNVVSNNAAAVISFPVVVAAAEHLGVSPMPFVVAVMFAASASFLTPVGYQTNLMVYGPGGYRVGDYLRVGAPLNLLTAAVALGLIPLIWPF